MIAVNLIPIPFLLTILVLRDKLSILVHSIPFVPKGKEKPWIFGALLLMIAFIISSLILAFGHRFLGLDILRVRMSVSIGFFLFCFIALVVFWNLRKRLGVDVGLG